MVARSVTPAKQLAAFIAEYDPAIAKRAKTILGKLRKRMPSATQLVYDNYNALVIGFGPSERASEVVLSIALYPKWITMFFLHGAKLPDPKKLLQGTGKQVRGVQLDEPGRLDDPGISALVDAAIARMPVSLPARGKGPLVIRSVSPKRRPRRPPAPTKRART